MGRGERERKRLRGEKRVAERTDGAELVVDGPLSDRLQCALLVRHRSRAPKPKRKSRVQDCVFATERRRTDRKRGKGVWDLNSELRLRGGGAQRSEACGAWFWGRD
jgi:hypothetical protein